MWPRSPRPDAANAPRRRLTPRGRWLAVAGGALSLVLVAAAISPPLGLVLALVVLWAADRWLLRPVAGLAALADTTSPDRPASPLVIATAMRDMAVERDEILSRHAAEQSRRQQLERDAFRDAPTGLPNRALFLDRVAHAVRRFRRPGAPGFAILLCAVEWQGSEAGAWNLARRDALRGDLARRLETVLRPGDTLAVYADPVFAVLIDNLETPTGARRCAERLAAALDGPLTTPEGPIALRSWFAIAPASPAHAGPVALLLDAAGTLEAAIAEDRRIAEFDPERMTTPASTDDFHARLEEILDLMSSESDGTAERPDRP